MYSKYIADLTDCSQADDKTKIIYCLLAQYMINAYQSRITGDFLESLEALTAAAALCSIGDHITELLPFGDNVNFRDMHTILEVLRKIDKGCLQDRIQGLEDLAGINEENENF